MQTIRYFSTPQLKLIHRGKVRESLRIDDKRRAIVATDRVSCFDRVFQTAIPHKGAVLNSLAAAWLSKTRHIIDNHLLEVIDPNISLVREVKPIRVEMIVRKYLTGSLWRKYERGERTISGVSLPDGMQRNDPFPQPILTPTTKGETDEEISPEAIVQSGLVDEKTYQKMEEVSLELFSYGFELCASKGVMLVDTKYEFGLCDGELLLIDEIHTPDSSRFWSAEHYEKDPRNEYSLDKEYIRQWVLSQPNKETIEELPVEVVQEASNRYLQVYEMLLGEALHQERGDMRARMVHSLQHHTGIKDAVVAIVMGSKKDVKHAMKIRELLLWYNVMVDLRVCSAHKNGEDLLALAEDYNHTAEPCAVIAVAGMSNGLGGALSANLTVPVVNCPPFKDQTDLLANINSSLLMPSNAPAGTCVGVDNAAQFALRSLNVPRIKELFAKNILRVKKQLRQEDLEVREEHTLELAR